MNTKPKPKVRPKPEPKAAPGEPPSVDLEPTAREWLTDALRALLNALPDPHSAKKRTTVLRLAFAMANREPVKDVFGRDDTCAEAIWYGKWQHNPAIKAAFDACYHRALDWRDKETTRIEADYRLKFRQAVAKNAALAPDAIASVMLDAKYPGPARTDAALKIVGLFDPDADKSSVYAPVGATNEINQNVNVERDMESLGAKRWAEVALLLSHLQQQEQAESDGQMNAPDPTL
jgi:hypothetical protein